MSDEDLTKFALSTEEEQQISAEDCQQWGDNCRSCQNMKAAIELIMHFTYNSGSTSVIVNKDN